VSKFEHRLHADRQDADVASVVQPIRPHALVICRDLESRSIGNLICQNARVTHLTFEALTPEIMTVYQPDMVLSPVVSGRYDCLDVARWLSGVGFLGAFRIFGTFPNNPHVLLSELKASCPGLDIALMAHI